MPSPNYYETAAKGFANGLAISDAREGRRAAKQNALARSNALADAGSMMDQGDYEGASNYLYSRGFTKEAGVVRSQSEAARHNRAGEANVASSNQNTKDYYGALTTGKANTLAVTSAKNEADAAGRRATRGETARSNKARETRLTKAQRQKTNQAIMEDISSTATALRKIPVEQRSEAAKIKLAAMSRVYNDDDSIGMLSELSTLFDNEDFSDASLAAFSQELDRKMKTTVVGGLSVTTDPEGRFVRGYKAGDPLDPSSPDIREIYLPGQDPTQDAAPPNQQDLIGAASPFTEQQGRTESQNGYIYQQQPDGSWVPIGVDGQ